MTPRPTTALRIPTVLALLAAAGLAWPTAARSQSRGSLQVTATVVPASASLTGLAAAQRAIDAWSSGRPAMTNDVSTLAQVAVAHEGAGVGTRGALIVNVDYLKN